MRGKQFERQGAVFLLHQKNFLLFIVQKIFCFLLDFMFLKRKKKYFIPLNWFSFVICRGKFDQPFSRFSSWKYAIDIRFMLRNSIESRQRISAEAFMQILSWCSWNPLSLSHPRLIQFCIFSLRNGMINSY